MRARKSLVLEKDGVIVTMGRAISFMDKSEHLIVNLRVDVL